MTASQNDSAGRTAQQLLSKSDDNTLMVGLWWPYQVRLLDAESIPQIVGLQAHGGDQIIPRSASALESHFNQGGQAIGVIHDGRLVGQALLRYDRVRSGQLTTVFASAAGTDSDVMRRMTIGCMTVAPEGRGKGLMTSLIGSAHSLARRLDIDIAHAHVKTDNVRSWRQFLASGFNITECGPSPDDESRRVYTMQKPLKQAFDHVDGSMQSVPVERPSSVKNLIDRNFVGTVWEPKTRCIGMMECRGLRR